MVENGIITCKQPKLLLSVAKARFSITDRKLSVIHARLRNNCSNLKHDLYTNFVEPDFSCRCGYSCEDANHYFFYMFSLFE